MNFIVTQEEALAYEVGYSCDNALFLSLGQERIFITDGRYSIEAHQCVQGARVVIVHDIVSQAATLIRLSRIKTLYADPQEWSVSKWDILVAKSGAKILKKSSLSPLKRCVKRGDELLKLRRAVAKGEECFDRFAQLISTSQGLTEKELFREAKKIFSDDGQQEVSFEPIVALNANSAKPHARPTDVRIQQGDLILVDAGVKSEGYCSDRTRVAQVGPSVHWGLNQIFTDPFRQKIYDTVLRAHDEAIALARPGMMAKEVDAIARRVIVEAGYGEYFVHSLGHGVGLAIHELPVISTRGRMILEEGMVFTIEPGIYLPDQFGVRIEDMVVMNSGGVEVL